MLELKFQFSLGAALLAFAGSSYGAAVITEYTPTTGRGCTTISSNHETGDTVKRCRGVAGFALLVFNSDDRASISLVTKNNATIPLDFWDVVTPTFSTLGQKVEWQMASVDGKKTPVALVVRVHTVDQTNVEAPRPLSFLVVAEIRSDKACVIGKIPAWQPKANESARALARARGSKCMPQIHQPSS